MSERSRKSPGFPHPARRSLALCATGCRHGCLRETPSCRYTYCIEIQLRKRPSSRIYLYIQYVTHTVCYAYDGIVHPFIRVQSRRDRCIRTDIVFNAGCLYQCIAISNSRSSRESPVSPSPQYAHIQWRPAAHTVTIKGKGSRSKENPAGRRALYPFVYGCRSHNGPLN